MVKNLFEDQGIYIFWDFSMIGKFSKYIIYYNIYIYLFNTCWKPIILLDSYSYWSHASYISHPKNKQVPRVMILFPWFKRYKKNRSHNICITLYSFDFWLSSSVALIQILSLKPTPGWRSVCTNVSYFSR